MIWVMIYIIILTMSIGIVNIVNIIINMRTGECKEYSVTIKYVNKEDSDVRPIKGN